MRIGFRNDWRLLRELLAILAVSAILGIAGIFFLGPWEFHENQVPAISAGPMVYNLSPDSRPITSLQEAGLAPIPRERITEKAPDISAPPRPPKDFTPPKVANLSSSTALVTPQSLNTSPTRINRDRLPLNTKPALPSASHDQPGLEQPPLLSEEDQETVKNEDPSSTEEGDLLIAGIVLTETGERVPGIKVIVSPRRLVNPGGRRAGPTGDRHTQTNESGFYELSNLYDGEYMLRTEATPYYQGASKLIRAGMEQVTLVLRREVPRRVEGLVKDADTGYPVSGVTISANNQLVSTDDTGYYQLSVPRQTPGQDSTIVRFAHHAYHEQMLTIPKRNAEVGTPTTLAAVALKPIRGFSSVEGTVESLYGGEPLANIRVFLSPAKSHTQLDTLTDDSGLFQFPSVAWGRYTLVIAPKHGYKDFTQQDVEVGQGGVANIQVRLEPSPAGSLAGQMVDPIGQPVRGLTLWLRSLTVRTFAGKPVTSDQSGHFEVHDVPAGELQFSTRSDPNLQINGLTLQPGISPIIYLVVDWGTQILIGQVVDAGGLPVPGAEVSLIWVQEKEGIQSRGIRTTFADDFGGFRFTQLGRGSHTLNVSAQGFQSTLLEHTIGPDQSDLRVVLSRVAS